MRRSMSLRGFIKKNRKSEEDGEIVQVVRHEEYIARRLVPEDTVNREAKIAARALGETDPPDVDRKESANVVVKLLETFIDEIRYDLGMGSNYRKFLLWLLYAIVLLWVVSLQRKVNDLQLRFQYISLRDTYFNYGTSVTRDTSEDVGDSTRDFTVIETHLKEVVLPSVFDNDQCGNGICETAWGEYPAWSPSPDAKFFQGCIADCGIAKTRPVNVVFFDVYKLQNAILALRDIAQSGDEFSGKTPEQWGAIDSDGSLLIEPRGGWNVCHKTDAEEGWNERVCVFQPGDININGSPYRTEELDPSSSRFAANKTLELYPGDWELRIAFDGFLWSDPDSEDTINIGFPAIRGALCYADTDEEECTFFGACPDAESCQCEFLNDEYICYDDEYWSTFDAGLMRHISPTGISLLDEDPARAAYPKASAIADIADWWGMPRSPNAEGGETTRYWTQRAPPDYEFAIANVSQWSSECDAYTLLLLNPSLSEAWDEEVVLQIWALDDSVQDLSMQSSQFDLNQAKSYLVYEVSMLDVDGGCDESNTIILCRDIKYTFGFRDISPGEPEERFTPGEALAYALIDKDTSRVVFRGNAAWTYVKEIQDENGTLIDTLPISLCPGDRFGDSCFDVNASNCFWNYNSVPIGTYCDPTLTHYGIFDPDEQNNAVVRVFFGNAGFESGSFCPTVSSCTRFIATYQGSTDGYFCQPSSVDDLVDLFNSVQEQNMTESAQMENATLITNDESVLLPANLLPSASHIACTFTFGICNSWFGTWRYGFGQTPTVGTGPGRDGDRTPFSSFAYAESSGSINSTFYLQSENFTQKLDEIALLTFRYHMYGVRTGVLAVQALIVDLNGTLDLNDDIAPFNEMTNGGPTSGPNGPDMGNEYSPDGLWLPVWYQQYNQGPFWYDASVTLPVNTLAIRFLAYADHESSDIAVDEIVVSVHPNASNTDASEEQTATSTCLDFVMINEAGSGWSASRYRISGNGISYRGTLNGISPELETHCFDPGCYDLSTNVGFAQLDYKFLEVSVSESLGSHGSYTVIRPRKVGFSTQIYIDGYGNAYEDSCTQSPTATPAPTVTPAPTCTATVLIEQRDSLGDGWNGAVYSMSRHNEIIATGTLNDGDVEVDVQCLSEPGCYNFTVTSGLHPEEASFSLEIPRLDQPNLIDASIPFTGSFYVDANDLSASFGSNSTCGPSSQTPPKSSFVTTHSPTPAPREAIRCYSNWRRVRSDSPEEAGTTPLISLAILEDDEYASESDLSFLEAEPFWENAPMTTIVECPTDNTGCVGTEFSWPPLEIADYFSAYDLRDEPFTYIGRGGCASDFPDMTPGDYSGCTHGDQGWWRFTPPSLCYLCEGDLCNLRDDHLNEMSPPGYSNTFEVPHVALYHSMDKAIESTRATAAIEFLSPSKLREVCDTGAVGNGECDTDLNILGCGYDLGDCVDSELTGATAPWLQSPEGAWPYAYATSTSVYATVPHVLHEAVRDKLKLHVLGNPDAFASSDEWLMGNSTDLIELLNKYSVSDLDELLDVLLPSMACPECPSYEGSYRAINFTVEATEASNTSLEDAERMFAEPSSSEFRIRYLSQPNIVLYGVLLTQTRKEIRNCPTKNQIHRENFVNDLQQNLNGVCSTTQSRLTKASRISTSITDTYNEAVKLNKVPFGVDATFLSSSSLYREENVASDFYAQDKIRDTGIPFGFDQRMGAPVVEDHSGNTYPRDFPVFIDVEANETRAAQIFQSIIDGGYFDSGTSSVTVSILTFNPETENFGLVESVYTNLPTGSVNADHSIVVFDISYYATALDYFRLALEILYVCLLIFLLSVEFQEIYDTIKRTGSVLGYFFDFSNFVDVFGYIFQFLIIPAWIAINRLLYDFKPEATYDIHDNLALGRILQAGTETHEAQFVIDEFREIRDGFGLYDLLCTFALIGLAVQSLKSLRFHPTFGLVSATIVAMSMRVIFWLFLLILVLSSYATLGTLLFGTDDPNYATFEASTVTLLAALSGMYDYTGLSLDDLQAQFFLWTYMFIAFFVLLNVLLAIIVEGYEASRGLSLKRDPLIFFIKATFGLTDAEDCLIPGHLLLNILNRVVHVLKNMPEIPDDGLDDTVHLTTIGTTSGDVEGGEVRKNNTEQRRVVSSFVRQFMTQTLSVVSSRFRSTGPMTYDAMLEWFEKDSRIKRAVARYRDRDNYLLGPLDVRRMAFEWKPAIDEELINIDMALIFVALRIITPIATNDISLVWHLVSLNLITRFGSDQSYGDASEEDEDGDNKISQNKIAYQRLIEVHRLIDLTEITAEVTLDCAALFAACYNYLQGRPDSLRAYTVDRLSEATNKPSLDESNGRHDESSKQRRQLLLRQIRDIVLAAQDDDLDIAAIGDLQAKINTLANSVSLSSPLGVHASVVPASEGLSSATSDHDTENDPLVVDITTIPQTT